jgi:dTDP-4-dehydrorhamnose reductase
MKILVTGGGGQLGRELMDTCPSDYNLASLSSSELDISDTSQVSRAVKELCPDVIINAAAYTAVDQAESDRQRAHAVNSKGAANIAGAAARHGTRLVHISTDFVFDGMKSSPYLPDDPPCPLSVYGKTKLSGENQVKAILKGRAVIIRTSWLYSRYGKNFVRTILSLMRERDELRVVSDQAGTPTWAKGLAEAVWKTVSMPDISGILHWSDSGIASWYDFACVIAQRAAAAGLIDTFTKILPVNTSAFPTPARRPSYSVLDKSASSEALGMIPPHWQENLRKMLEEYAIGAK